jgi:hypothetical protein
MNDDWTMTAGIIYQKTKSDGRSEHDPVHAGDLNLVRFKPEFEFDHQDWTQYALTFEGDLGFADFVSATAYFTRDWTYTQDTSVGYMAYFGTFCYNPYFIAYSRYCWQAQSLYDSTVYRGTYYNDGTGYLENVAQTTKFSQEFRLFHQGETIDWVAGFFTKNPQMPFNLLLSPMTIPSHMPGIITPLEGISKTVTRSPPAIPRAAGGIQMTIPLSKIGLYSVRRPGTSPTAGMSPPAPAGSAVKWIRPTLSSCHAIT